MSAGDITYKYVKITVDDEDGVINYAEQKYIEDSEGDLHKSGSLHRPGLVPPRVGDTFDDDGNILTWKDNNIADKPQVIQDLATAMWSSTRKEAYENKNS